MISLVHKISIYLEFFFIILDNIFHLVINESTIFEMTEDSSEESDDDDASYIPWMNLEDHCYEEDMNEISDDSIICA